MSLHKFAEQVAANGRGDDSLLVHMTPDEVQRLQSFAQANGRSLTINPETGLPEAGILSDLFKAVAPIALGAFLGPAGMGLTFGGLSSAMSAGIATGGITALATGSLSRGLMAGLGAYGGAGLGQGLMGAATTGDAFQAAQSNLGPEANAMSVRDVAASANINPVTSGLQALGTEQGRAAALNAMGGTKGALTAAGMAAAPLMAMQPTTKMPETKGTGYIRQFDYNINPDTGKPDPLYGMRAMTPVKASEWGDKTFQGQRDLFRQQNPNPYELGTASLNQPPKPMATGGITSLAGGGQPSMAEWLDKVGISQEAREKGSPELYTAVNAYTALGSSLDPYRQKDTRDWSAVMAAENPTDALIQQNLPLYGGAGHLALTDTGGMLVSGAGNNLTSDLSRYEEFGVKLNPTQIKNTLNSMQTNTPAARAQYNRINAMYEEAVRQAQEGAKTLAGGGIVALAQGGVPGYADGGPLDVNNPIYQYFAKPETQALLASGNDKAIADALQKNDWKLADVAAATGTQDRLADYSTRFVNAVNTPTTSAEEFQAMTSDVGLQNEALANAVKNSGMSAAAQYAVTHRLDDAAGIASAPQAAQAFYNSYGYQAGNAPGDQGGLEGLYSNIGYAANKLQDQINAGKLTVQQAQNLSLAEMERLGINQADVKAATGKAFGDLFTPKNIPITCPTGYKLNAEGTACIKETVIEKFVNVVPGGTQLPGATVYDNGAYGNYGSGDKTGTDYLGRTVSIATPGDIITNPDGTRTVVPNIPGRPYGGFTGMEGVKSAYTAGGGSLGYTAKAPRTIDEFNQLYNKQTGDSLAAYDYLMGKGGGKYPVKSGVPQISQNYGEYVLGKKPVAPTAKPKTTEKTVATGDAAVVGGISFDLTDPTKQPVEDNNGPWSWDVAAKRWVQYGRFADGGMTGYAMGGGLGSLGSYSDGGRLLKGPGDGVSDSIPATIGNKQQPARLADGEFVVPARIVSELGNGSTEAGAKKLYAMMDRVQKARGKTTGKNKVAANSRADKYLPA